MSFIPNFKLKINKDFEMDLVVDDNVFSPTGTTKLLIEAVAQDIEHAGKLLDLGAGSGAVGIALKQMGCVDDILYCSDLSPDAIACIEMNAQHWNCPVMARSGTLFSPWENEKFDYVVNDISGVSENVAALSPWFKNVPCASGVDGTTLIVEVLDNAPDYLEPDGRLFFPVISLSNVGKILNAARKKFKKVELLREEHWPLPKEMSSHLEELKKLKHEGHIDFSEKFGLIIWSTRVYVASQ